MGEESKKPSESNEEKISGITSLIPEIYYDLIARVPAGVIIVAATYRIISQLLGFCGPTISTLLNSNGIPVLTFVIAVLIMGGLIGILLSPLASFIRALYWKNSWISVVEGPYRNISSTLISAGYGAIGKDVIWKTLKSSDLHGLDRWVYDYLLLRNPVARSLLPKLRAEADLASYLAAALVVIPLIRVVTHFLLYMSGMTTVNLADEISWGLLANIVAVLLCGGLLYVTGAYRTKRLLLRMLSMLSVLVDGKGIAPLSPRE